ncbi:MAG: hypothetical protein OXI58_04725 [Gemmatimonadota bacterium]|nr:hypothetical protein [Gemmatimonadota bacterium]
MNRVGCPLILAIFLSSCYITDKNESLVIDPKRVDRDWKTYLIKLYAPFNLPLKNQVLRGRPPYSYGLNGPLPDGIRYVEEDLILTGTPIETGTFDIIYVVQDRI